MKTAMAMLLAFGLLGAPALAEGQRDGYECSGLQSCTPGTACTDGGSGFLLAFLGGGIEVRINGETLHPVYDGDLRTAAWRSQGAVYQMRLTGDGSGVLTVTPEVGDFTQSRTEWLHCSPE